MLAEARIAPALQAVGWIGQACFFSRFFVQWLASERARRSIVPPSFWWLSLAGSLLMSSYALRTGETLLLFGYAVGGAIATRNLLLVRSRAVLHPGALAAVALGLVAGLLWLELDGDRLRPGDGVAWFTLGILGQTLWVSRFPVQWWLSERAGHSHFPRAFWWISLAGNALLLAYTLHLGDPRFWLGFLPGPVLQVRNLVLARREPRPT